MSTLNRMKSEEDLAVVKRSEGTELVRVSAHSACFF